jgi:hypothetical protein
VLRKERSSRGVRSERIQTKRVQPIFSVLHRTLPPEKIEQIGPMTDLSILTLDGPAL